MPPDVIERLAGAEVEIRNIKESEKILYQKIDILPAKISTMIDQKLAARDEKSKECSQEKRIAIEANAKNLGMLLEWKRNLMAYIITTASIAGVVTAAVTFFLNFLDNSGQL